MTSVYFITDGEYIKIGIAKDVKSRMHSLQTGNPKKLRLLKSIQYSDPDAIAREKELHNRFRKFRQFGEWFSASDELIQFIGNEYFSSIRKDELKIYEEYCTQKRIEYNQKVNAYREYYEKETSRLDKSISAMDEVLNSRYALSSELYHKINVLFDELTNKKNEKEHLTAEVKALKSEIETLKNEKSKLSKRGFFSRIFGLSPNYS